MQLSVDFERLRADLEELAQIGREEDHGIHRVAFSDAFMRAHAWFQAKLREAGLDVRVDEALNVIGRLEGHEGPSGAIATGSHLDSVPGGGHLDGALGVVAGLEVLRRFKELGIQHERPLEVIAFTDEEGRFGGMLGSQAFAGHHTPETLLTARDLEGHTLSAVMGSMNLDPLHMLRASRAPNDLEGFVELHIEQGPVLDQKGAHVGVVDGIVGLFKWECKLLGVANHAGTTPMNMRKDAFQGLAEFAGEIERVIEENGSPTAVATIGRVEIHPGAPNVVPAQVTFSLEARDLDPDVLADLANGFRRALSAIARRRGLMFEYQVLSEIEPVVCDAAIVEAISKATATLGLEPVHLPSGAAHDAQMLADIAPVGMIFVASKDGRSHSPAEWTAWESIEYGANCLLRTLHTLAGHHA